MEMSNEGARLHGWHMQTISEATAYDRGDYDGQSDAAGGLPPAGDAAISRRPPGDVAHQHPEWYGRGYRDGYHDGRGSRPAAVLTHPRHPLHWIVTDDTGAYLVPAQAGGWQRRSRLRTVLPGAHAVNGVLAENVLHTVGYCEG